MADSNSTEPDNAKPQKVHAVQDTFEPGSVGKLVSFGFIWAGVLLYVLNSVYEEKMAKKAITRS